MERSGRCILVCAGDFTPVDLGVTNDDFLIAVDAGLEHLLRIDTLPDHLVGDFDSLDESYRELVDRMEEAHPESVTRLNPVKDDTDAMAAVMIGMERGYRRFYIYGGMGGRLDHTLGNQCTQALAERYFGVLFKHSASAYLAYAGDDDVGCISGEYGQDGIFLGHVIAYRLKQKVPAQSAEERAQGTEREGADKPPPADATHVVPELRKIVVAVCEIEDHCRNEQGYGYFECG